MAPSKRKASKIEKINKVKNRRNLLKRKNNLVHEFVDREFYLARVLRKNMFFVDYLGLKSWKSRRRFILYKNLLQNKTLAGKQMCLNQNFWALWKHGVDTKLADLSHKPLASSTVVSSFSRFTWVDQPIRLKSPLLVPKRISFCVVDLPVSRFGGESLKNLYDSQKVSKHTSAYSFFYNLRFRYISNGEFVLWSMPLPYLVPHSDVCVLCLA